MPNGMEKVKIIYKTISGDLDEIELLKVLNLYSCIFEDADIPFFKHRFTSQEKSLTLLAFYNSELVGFKIGYPYNKSTFYSWIGGVHLNFRKQGIASKLAALQEKKVKSLGLTKLRTKSMNQYKPMMMLNLKNGFDIIKIYTNDSEQTKIVFEKALL